MKKQLLAVIAGITSFCSHAQTEKNDLAIYNLRGKVKSVNETVYEAKEKFGELEKGTQTARYNREFNKEGFELQYLHETYDDGEKDKFVRTTRYENNKPVEIKEDDNGDVELEKYKYNQQGLVESIDALDSDGDLLYRQKNKYNADGLVIQADTYKGDGSTDMKTVSSYNAKKQVIKEQWYDKDGKLTTVNTYVYDGRGQVVEESSVDYKRKDPKTYVEKYMYDDKGRKIEQLNSMSGSDTKEIFEYNAQGDVVKNRDGYGNEVKKVYNYDAQNNWTRCITTKESYGKTSHEIIERQVRYY